MRIAFFLLSMLCISTVLLASCGGGSGEEQTSDAKSADGRKEALAVPPGWKGRAPTYEVINGITVPPEPAPSINNATLTGVDINNNGVRDDVERRIAIAYPDSYQDATAYARIIQAMMGSLQPTKESATKQMADTMCNKLDNKVVRQVLPQIINNEKRRLQYRYVVNSAGVMLSLDLPECAQ